MNVLKNNHGSGSISIPTADFRNGQSSDNIPSDLYRPATSNQPWSTCSARSSATSTVSANDLAVQLRGLQISANGRGLIHESSKFEYGGEAVQRPPFDTTIPTNQIISKQPATDFLARSSESLAFPTYNTQLSRPFPKSHNFECGGETPPLNTTLLGNLWFSEQQQQQQQFSATNEQLGTTLLRNVLFLQQQWGQQREQLSKTTDMRYKTELCRTFSNTGMCKYLDKCWFAHGVSDQRKVRRHPNYKTKLCRSYNYGEGYCPYGPRCHYIHLMENEHSQLPKLIHTQRVDSDLFGHSAASSVRW